MWDQRGRASAGCACASLEVSCRLIALWPIGAEVFLPSLEGLFGPASAYGLSIHTALRHLWVKVGLCCSELGPLLTCRAGVCCMACLTSKVNHSLMTAHAASTSACIRWNNWSACSPLFDLLQSKVLGYCSQHAALVHPPFGSFPRKKVPEAPKLVTLRQAQPRIRLGWPCR